MSVKAVSLGRFYIQQVQAVSLGRFYILSVKAVSLGRFYILSVESVSKGRFYIQQVKAIPCNTMQYHACLATADRSHHCPVGSILPYLVSHQLNAKLN